MIALQVLWISGLAAAVSDGFLKVWPEGCKPFTCWRCMSLWLGLASAGMMHEPMFMFLPYLVSKVLSKIIWS